MKKFRELNEGRSSQRHPLEGHEYHRKTDAELIGIAKDAHKAAEAMKGHNTQAENKYRDQANDSATVRYYRQKNGMPDWYKKKYGHMKEAIKDKFDIGEYDQEGDMAKSDLRSIIANAQKMHDMLDDADNLPEWVQSKITKAEDYISTVANYMTAEMNEEWSKTGKEAKHRETGEKTYGYHELDKEGKPTGKREYRNAQGKSMGEEVEQIDEISSDVLRRAKHKAYAMSSAADQAGKTKEADKRFSQGIKFQNREYDVSKKEGAKLSKYMAQKEEVEQVDELSKNTLGNYIDKAQDSARKMPGYGTNAEKSKKTMRLAGIEKASNKMTKEEVEQIDEISPALAGKYLDKVYKTKGFTGHSEKRNKGLERATNKVANAARMADYETSRKMGYSTEEVEHLDEKNVPTSPEKWAQAKAQAKAKFDVYPSAYANGWAAKKYKAMGGGWKSVSEAKEDDLPFTPDAPKKKSVVVGKKPEGYSVARHLARMAMKKQAEKMKKPIKEEESKKAKIVKDIMKKKKSSEDAFQDEPVLSSTVTKQE